LYGRVDGMYSRPVLLQSLREQKMQSAKMIKIMGSQTVQIENMTSTLDNEISRRKKLEGHLKTSEEDNRRGKMAMHHMQSEIQRLETIIEVLDVLHCTCRGILVSNVLHVMYSQWRLSIPTSSVT
jgi:hypothetical protein